MPNHRALQQRVFNQALARLSECLAVPNDRAMGICVELGIAHAELRAAVRRQQVQQEEHLLEDACDASLQVRALDLT